MMGRGRKGGEVVEPTTLVLGLTAVVLLTAVPFLMPPLAGWPSSLNGLLYERWQCADQARR